MVVHSLLPGSVMDRQSQFRMHARECRELAAREPDAGRRALFTHMAAHWDALADLWRRLERRAPAPD